MRLSTRRRRCPGAKKAWSTAGDQEALDVLLDEVEARVGTDHAELKALREVLDTLADMPAMTETSDPANQPTTGEPEESATSTLFHVGALLLESRRIILGFALAGAVVAGPSLRGLELMDDPFELPDGYDEPLIWHGLGLTPFAIVPHYQSRHPEAYGLVFGGKSLGMKGGQFLNFESNRRPQVDVWLTVAQALLQNGATRPCGSTTALLDRANTVPDVPRLQTTMPSRVAPVPIAWTPSSSGCGRFRRPMPPSFAPSPAK